MRCKRCRNVINQQGSYWACAYCEVHFLCEQCEKRMVPEHPMTLLKTKQQQDIFRLTSPLFSGKLVNKYNYKNQQDSWIIKNTGKCGWQL